MEKDRWEAAGLKLQAYTAARDYEGNRDDQFDLFGGFSPIAIAAKPIAALADSYGLLDLGWFSGGAAALLGTVGFAGLTIHRDEFTACMA